jgi:hypothetical protein
MNLQTLLVLIATLLIGNDAAEVQRKPDFSGTWTLAHYRIGDKVVWSQGSGGSQNAMVGGAAVNCGLRCTITQTANTLTVSRAANGGAQPPDEVVFLDGRPMANQAAVEWDGSRLTLVRRFAGIVVTQTLAVEKDRLIVVAALASSDVGPYVLTYERASKAP